MTTAESAPQKQRHRLLPAVLVCCHYGAAVVSLPSVVQAFVVVPKQQNPPARHNRHPNHDASLTSTTATTCRRMKRQSVYPSSFALHIYAPPGSGYFSADDETSTLPDSYEPMMEYPGTMRPGRTPENIPYQDLPIGDDDPDDPVPWPHFQQIEWHHRWDPPPHEHATPMELFIEQQGRWATPELEAEMRAGVRRGVREKKEAEEAQRRGTIITDDDEDEDDDEMVIDEAPVSLGDGIFGQLGSAADQAATAAAVDPKNQEAQKQQRSLFDEDKDDEDDEDEDDSALDDFLFDLGLDSELDDDSGGASSSSSSSSAPKTVAKSLRDLESKDDDDDEEGVSAAASQTIHVEQDDDDLDFVEDDDDDDLGGGQGSGGGGPVPLDDFGGSDEDALDGEDIFDEGGFDFDDDFDDGGGDMW